MELLAPFRPKAWVTASAGVSAAVVVLALSPFGQSLLHSNTALTHVSRTPTQTAGVAASPGAVVTPPAAVTTQDPTLAERPDAPSKGASSTRRAAPVVASALRASTEPDSIVDGQIQRQRYSDEIINDQFYLERGLEGQQNPSVVPANETQDDGVYIVF